jgi:DNA-binding ferritin-like protein (Dps family)
LFGKNTDIKKIWIDKDWNTKKETVKRDKLETWDSFGHENHTIYIKGLETQFSWKKDAYAIRKLQEGETIYVIAEHDGTDAERISAIGGIADDKDREKQMKAYTKEKDRVKALFVEMRKSKRVSYYEDIEVDDEWLKEFKKVAQEREEIASLSYMTPEERRKVQERMVAYTLRECIKHSNASTASESGYIWDKVEPRTSDLMNTETVTYYGSKEDEGSLILAANILNFQNPKHTEVWPDRSNNWDEQNDRPVYFWEYPPVRSYNGDEPTESYTNNQKLDWDRPQLLRVNEKVAKHIASNPYCKHIDEFFYTATDNNHFSVDPAIRRWYTGFNMKLEHDEFMEKMKLVNKDMYENYKEIQKYINSTTGHYGIKNYLDNPHNPQMKMFKKMIEFNSFLDTLNQDGESTVEEYHAIKAKSRELFVFTDVTCNSVVDQDRIIAYEDMLLYLEPIALFLNSIEHLGEDLKDNNTGDEFSKELNAYLGFKKRLGWKPPINLLTLNKNN